MIEEIILRIVCYLVFVFTVLLVCVGIMSFIYGKMTMCYICVGILLLICGIALLMKFMINNYE